MDLSEEYEEFFQLDSCDPNALLKQGWLARVDTDGMGKLLNHL